MPVHFYGFLPQNPHYFYFLHLHLLDILGTIIVQMYTVQKTSSKTGLFRRILCILLPVICRIDKTEPAWIAPCRFRFSCMLLRNCMLDLSEAYSMLVEDVCGYLPAASSRKVMPVLRRNLRTGLPKSASTRRCPSHRSQTGRYSCRRASNCKR